MSIVAEVFVNDFEFEGSPLPDTDEEFDESEPKREEAEVRSVGSMNLGIEL